jgi:hypothetical protein
VGNREWGVKGSCYLFPIFFRRKAGMGKKIYAVDGHLYIVDDETGKVKEVIIKETNISVETLEKLIKILATEANKNDS